MIKNYIRSMFIRFAFRILSKAMKDDPEYAWSWQCNLAMMAYDAGASHEKANRRAATLMRILFGVDVINTHMWKDFERRWSKCK